MVDLVDFPHIVAIPITLADSTVIGRIEDGDSIEHYIKQAQQWLEEGNIKQRHYYGGASLRIIKNRYFYRFYFENQEDAALFKLFWMQDLTHV